MMGIRLLLITCSLLSSPVACPEYCEIGDIVYPSDEGFEYEWDRQKEKVGGDKNGRTGRRTVGWSYTVAHNCTLSVLLCYYKLAGLALCAQGFAGWLLIDQYILYHLTP